MSVKVKLPDGTIKELPDGSTGYDMAKSIGQRLAKAAIAVKVDGKVVDLCRPLPPESSVVVVTEETEEGEDVIRHSASHVLAGAVKRLFPETKLAIGPSIEKGFYYDFDSPRTFTEDDLQKLEAEMKKIVDADYRFERSELPMEEAIATMEGKGEKYKAEILRDLRNEGEKNVSFYKDGDFTDLCTGPHVPSSSRIKAFKLLKTTGAYWRGSEKNQMLQRIYGTAFHAKNALDDYLRKIEEAKQRDHRKLGKDLDLFSIHEEIGGGLVHWHPKGAMVRHLVEQAWKELHIQKGYQLVYTPHIASEEIYKISGHLENYAELMYAPMDIEGRPFRVKPMNCPGHIMIYKTRLHSYQELPLRLAELGTVYRFERSGVLHGLLRVRGFTIDDSHIFCTPEQLEQEILSVFDLSLNFLKSFGFNQFDIYLATRPEKAVGAVADWEKATQALRSALEKTGVAFEVDEGGGAFYGPKIDVKVKDCLGRPWQCSTVQFDFNLPERFDINFIGPEGTRRRPYMVHRALMGSVERFIGVLIEHYNGAFPLWLAPVQAVVLNVTEQESSYARGIHERLLAEGFRSELDLRNESISYKIRQHTMQKVPYMLIVGPKEAKENAVALRDRTKGDQGKQTIEQFIAMGKDQIRERR